MTCQGGPERASYVREMFGDISDKYDLMNRLMTFGQDRPWRRYVVRMAALPAGGRLLDAGTGTGDIALEAVHSIPGLAVVGVDFTFQMMQVGFQRCKGKRILFCSADALQLPFPDATFDAVTSGYLVRNVSNVYKAFKEQIRVVKPGGRIVCLDTSPSQSSIVRPFVVVHFKVVIPLLGYLFARNKIAYRYLYESTKAFMKPDELASIMTSIGLQNVFCKRLMFGTQVVLCGMRPDE